MLYWQLLFSFLKIGLFAFGGGYAMIPLIQSEILGQGWLSAQEFANIVAVSQMTPGPIAINAATFVGYRICGLGGATVATLGVIIPPFFLTLVVSKLFYTFQERSLVQGVFSGIRPAVIALISSAAIFLVPSSIMTLSQGIIALLTTIVILRTRISPLVLIFLGGMFGVITSGLGLN